MKYLKYFFLVNDVGFILYWAITLLHIVPAEYLYNNYFDPMMVAWNWSFFPLDMLISFTGLTSIYLYKKKKPFWPRLSLISLVLTFCSGLMAISFWTLTRDFNLSFWVMNLFLMVYPLFFFKKIMLNPEG